MLVSVHALGVALTPLKVIVPLPCGDPNPDPPTETDVPVGPELGVKLVIVGVGKTVKATPLLGTAATVTTTLPVIAPVGTVTTMVDPFQETKPVAATPPNVTLLAPCEEPKLLPLIVTCAPCAPAPGDRLPIAGVVPPAPAARKATTCITQPPLCIAAVAL
jgi:hypothetical protein